MAYDPGYAARQNDITRRYKEAMRARERMAEGGADRAEREALKAQWGVQGGSFYQGDDEDAARDAYHKTAASDDAFRATIDRRIQELGRERQEAAFEDAYNYRPEQLQMEAAGSGYQAKNVSAMPQWNAARNAITNRLRSQANAARSTASDAMQRQFARLGGLNSGSAIKAQANLNQQSQEQEAEQLSSALAQIGMQETGAQQAEDAKAFQSAEAISARNAARQQFNSESDFKAAVFRADAASKLGQMDMAWSQFDWSKYLDSQKLAQNAQMIENSKPSVFGEIMGGIGSLAGAATGLGALGWSPLGKKG